MGSRLKRQPLDLTVVGVVELSMFAELFAMQRRRRWTVRVTEFLARTNHTMDFDELHFSDHLDHLPY